MFRREVGRPGWLSTSAGAPQTSLGGTEVEGVQAMVAHEIGHEYFWPEFERSNREHDLTARQVLELKCDGTAAPVEQRAVQW